MAMTYLPIQIIIDFDVLMILTDGAPEVNKLGLIFLGWAAIGQGFTYVCMSDVWRFFEVSDRASDFD